jgi:hypothetical protein
MQHQGMRDCDFLTPAKVQIPPAVIAARPQLYRAILEAASAPRNGQLLAIGISGFTVSCIGQVSHSRMSDLTPGCRITDA